MDIIEKTVSEFISKYNIYEKCQNDALGYLIYDIMDYMESNGVKYLHLTKDNATLPIEIFEKWLSRWNIGLYARIDEVSTMLKNNLDNIDNVHTISLIFDDKLAISYNNELSIYEYYSNQAYVKLHDEDVELLVDEIKRVWIVVSGYGE